MNQSDRDKNLLKNIVLFGISSFGTRLIYFFLIPLYTSNLSTGDYGAVDLINIVISLITPILTVGIAESVLRFTIIMPEKRESILDCSLIVLMADMLILGAGIGLIWKFNRIELEPIYYIFLMLSFLLNTLYQIFCNFFRGADQAGCMMAAGMLNAAVTCISNIVFLAHMGLGVRGYLCAMLLGVFIADVFFILQIRRRKLYSFGGKRIDRLMFKSMIDYGKPLILNGISWWINNSLDRVIIVGILDTAANGIYAVSYKIPSILSVFQTIFNQAWTVSAIQEYGSDDKDSYYSKMYKVYEAGMFLICSLLLLLNMFLAKLLYAKDFFTAWHYTIPLMIAALAGAMSIFMSSIFCAVGDTKTVGMTTLVGAIVNLGLNLLLIPKIGLLGAAVATVISNIVIWFMRRIKSEMYIRLDTRPVRELTCFILVVIQGTLAYQEIHFYLLQAVVFCVLIVLFREEVGLYLHMARKVYDFKGKVWKK
ncbi:MAG: oligosaccharide flippase family protein [Lachnospiraceae bacterium]|nr:oligosaccharide flippase family protein [Lachnospiraceae bacterium]